MKKSILLILGIIILASCQRNNDDDTIIDNPNPALEGVCDWKTEILSPSGFELNTIGEIDFNGSVQAFQFVDEQTGFAMLGNNVGGYVEVFKTSDGGVTWDNLNIETDKIPRSMVFRDENFGIITVHDITGCPSNCQNKCVILKTENGGIDWEEVEIEELSGILYHPQFDDEGNLYANLSLNDQWIIVKSTDNGENWDTLFDSPELYPTLITFSFKVFQDKIYAPARDGNLLVLDANGQLIKTINMDDTSVWDLEIIDENNLVMAVSGKLVKSINGGDTWETIHDQSARIIGFDSADEGLMLLRKSSCPTDVYQVNDLIASTSNGGLNWSEAEETTTNLNLHFSNSQRMDDGIWYFMIGNELLEIKEN